MQLVIIFLIAGIVLLGYLLFTSKGKQEEAERKAFELQANIANEKDQRKQEEFKHRQELRQIQTQVGELQTEMNRLVQERCQSWVQKESEAIKAEQRELALREAAALLESWKFENEQKIGDKAIRQSAAVTLGKVTEHFIPYLPGFNYNPKDARFIGSPVDFIVFDGMDEGDVCEVVFVEVKSGAATLTKRQRQIRDAVNDHRCRWELINLDEAKQGQRLLSQAAL
jgi:predicted Holliday junction resolvase-like endonuclease